MIVGQSEERPLSTEFSEQPPGEADPHQGGPLRSVQANLHRNL